MTFDAKDLSVLTKYFKKPWNDLGASLRHYDRGFSEFDTDKSVVVWLKGYFEDNWIAYYHMLFEGWIDDTRISFKNSVGGIRIRQDEMERFIQIIQEFCWEKR